MSTPLHRVPTLALAMIITFKLQASCMDANPHGIGGPKVEEGKLICIEAQVHKGVATKLMSDLQAIHFDKNTNFGFLANKYRAIEAAAKKDAEHQKFCKERNSHFKSEVENLCDTLLPLEEALCRKDVKELEQLASYCEKNESAAEDLAKTAAEDAALFEKKAS